MKKSVLILSSFLTFNLNAQTNFDRGYKVGWEEGYCYNSQSVSCIPPNSPIAPIPRINEDMNSYQDGYNRGFVEGREKRQVSSNRPRYQTTRADIANDYMFEPDWNLIYSALQVKQKEYDDTISYLDYLANYIDSLNLDDNLYSYYKTNVDKVTQALKKDGNVRAYTKFIRELVSELNDDLRKINFENISRKEASNIHISNSDSSAYTPKTTSIPNKIKEEEKESDYFSKIYSGIVSVYTYTPLYDIPDIEERKVIYRIPNNRVKILNREREGKYYKVYSNGKIGYIFTGFIIK